MIRRPFPLLLFVFLLVISSTAAQEAGAQSTAVYGPFASSFAGETPVPDEDAAEENRFGKDRTEMVYIPDGPFLMGSDDETALPDTRPAHEVVLKAYRIDRYEVTNRQFAMCVETGYCYPPRDLSSSTRPDYYTNEAYADYPVIHVDWNQAQAYCSWAGKRLPTEAEWEKAARGTQGDLYPWGNWLPAEIPAQTGLFGSGDTAPVDSFPEGASIYGVYNMAGNVWEWTADQYDQYYYSKSPAQDPKAVTGGNEYVIRGYSWAHPFSRYEITLRNASYVLNHTWDLGFRCAMDAE